MGQTVVGQNAVAFDLCPTVRMYPNAVKQIQGWIAQGIPNYAQPTLLNIVTYRADPGLAKSVPNVIALVNDPAIAAFYTSGFAPSQVTTMIIDCARRIAQPPVLEANEMPASAAEQDLVKRRQCRSACMAALAASVRVPAGGGVWAIPVNVPIALGNGQSVSAVVEFDVDQSTFCDSMCSGKGVDGRFRLPAGGGTLLAP